MSESGDAAMCVWLMAQAKCSDRASVQMGEWCVHEVCVVLACQHPPHPSPPAPLRPRRNMVNAAKAMQEPDLQGAHKFGPAPG